MKEFELRGCAEAELAWARAARVAYWGLPLAVLLSIACVLWVDLPLALWLHRSGADRHLWMRHLLGTPILLGPLAGLYLPFHAWRMSRSRATRRERAWFVIANALLATLAVKEMLKLAFGRTWPRDVSLPISAVDAGCTPGSLGYVNDGLHAFHAFGGTTKAYMAFPSGSTAALLAVLVPLHWLHPRARPLLWLFAAVSLAAFVVTNTHFVADVIAGAYVGSVAGTLAIAVIADGRAARP